MVFFQLCPNCSIIIYTPNFFLSFTILSFDIVSVQTYARPIFLVKIQQKSKTCKVRNASCRFWKIYNFQIFGQSTDRTGRGREVDPLVGFPWNTQIFGIFSTHIHHTNMSKMFWRFISQTCLRRLFQCQYFSRPLFEIFEQEWIPWFELHVVEKSTHWPWVTQGGGVGGNTVWCHARQSVLLATLSCASQHVVIKMGRLSGMWAIFHICEMALFDNTCDRSLDVDVFLGVLVQIMWVEEDQ